MAPRVGILSPVSVFLQGVVFLPSRRLFLRFYWRSCSALGPCLNCFSRMWVLPSESRVTYEEVFMSDDSGNSFLWFLAGLGLGAVAGVLYAPRSGDETREALRSKAEESRERLRHHAREAKSQASDWVDRGRDVLSQQKDQLRAAYDAGRQAYHEATAAEGGAAKN